MKKIYLILLGSLVCISGTAQDLDFNSTAPIYPNGNTSHSYTPAIGNSASVVSITASGSTNRFVGATQPRPRSNGLQSQVNFETTAECITFTITFTPSVTGLQFYMYGVDRGTAQATMPVTYSFVDQASISGDLSGAAVVPTIGNDVGAPGNSVSGTTITGIANKDAARNLVTFPTAVDRVVITYCSGSNAMTNPESGQAITIGDMEWDPFVALPVNLLSFGGGQVENTNVVAWQTSEEINSDYFEVQRGSDGTSFETIERVKSAGNTQTSQTYQYTDREPLQGYNYYRLKQTDFDGKSAYSKIIAVYYEQDGFYAFVQNPAKNYEIVVHTNASSPTIELYSMLGQRLPTTLQAAEKGVYRLRSSLFQNGKMYLLRLQTADNKFFKQKILVVE